jgi:putative oxidoreductase
MRTLSLSPVARFAGFAPLVVRVIVGVIMFAHGLQKLTQMGPGNFGGQCWRGSASPCRSLWDTW